MCCRERSLIAEGCWGGDGCRWATHVGEAEGVHSRGGNRTARYHTALGSAQETLACLEAAEACGYVAAADPAIVQQLRRVVGTLVKLVAG